MLKVGVGVHVWAIFEVVDMIGTVEEWAGDLIEIREVCAWNHRACILVLVASSGELPEVSSARPPEVCVAGIGVKHLALRVMLAYLLGLRQGVRPSAVEILECRIGDARAVLPVGSSRQR